MRKHLYYTLNVNITYNMHLFCIAANLARPTPNASSSPSQFFLSGYLTVYDNMWRVFPDHHHEYKCPIL